MVVSNKMVDGNTWLWAFILHLILERSTIWDGWSDEQSTDESGYPRTTMNIEILCLLVPESGGKFYKVIGCAHRTMREAIAIQEGHSEQGNKTMDSYLSGVSSRDTLWQPSKFMTAASGGEWSKTY